MDASPSEQIVISICDGIGESTSLKQLTLGTFPAMEETTDRVSKYLTNALVKLPTLVQIQCLAPDLPGPFAFARLCSALRRTRPFQESDMTYAYHDGNQDGHKHLYLLRGACWWKTVLARDTPLPLWPQVLDDKFLKGDENEKYGHTTTDILYFFL